MKRLSIRGLGMLVLFLLCCIACTDHEPQQQILPVIKTEETSTQPQTYLPVFNLRIESLGNVGIVEYGTAYLLAPYGANPQNYVPTINSNKVIFSFPANVGTHSKVAPFSDTQVDVFYYRAYAILQNGNVIYGDTYSGD